MTGKVTEGEVTQTEDRGEWKSKPPDPLRLSTLELGENQQRESKKSLGIQIGKEKQEMKSLHRKKGIKGASCMNVSGRQIFLGR